MAELRTGSKYKISCPSWTRKGHGSSARDGGKNRSAVPTSQQYDAHLPERSASATCSVSWSKDPKDEFVVGVEGIERSMEEYLKGIDGFRHIERDRTGREIVIYRGQEQACATA